MDARLDENTRTEIRENCACLMSNDNSVYAKEFRRLRKQCADEDEYLRAAVEYLNGTTPLRRCGAVTLRGGAVLTEIARGRCECPTIRDALIRPISVTWCHCCKGNMLSVIRRLFPERQCDMRIVETIATGGAVCLFEARFRDE